MGEKGSSGASGSGGAGGEPPRAKGQNRGDGRRPNGQWAKGKSGNDGGRPRGSRNMSTIVAEMLAERIELRDKAGTRRIGKLEAAIRQLYDKAIRQGHFPSLCKILDMAEKLEPKAGDVAPPIVLTEADRCVLEELARRIRPAANPQTARIPGAELNSNPDGGDDVA